MAPRVMSLLHAGDRLRGAAGELRRGTADARPEAQHALAADRRLEMHSPGAGVVRASSSANGARRKA